MSVLLNPSAKQILESGQSVMNFCWATGLLVVYASELATELFDVDGLLVEYASEFAAGSFGDGTGVAVLFGEYACESATESVSELLIEFCKYCGSLTAGLYVENGKLGKLCLGVNALMCGKLNDVGCEFIVGVGPSPPLYRRRRRRVCVFLVFLFLILVLLFVFIYNQMRDKIM
jgi:hypothetical protein